MIKFFYFSFFTFILFLFGCKQPSKDRVDSKTNMQEKDSAIMPASDSITIIYEDTSTIIWNTEFIQASANHDVEVEPEPGKPFKLVTLNGLDVSVAATGLQRPRFLSYSPDKRLFVTDMYDRSDNTKGKVVVFDRWNETTKTFDTTYTYLDGLRNPNQVLFYAGYIYVAETHQLSRYKYRDGDIKPFAKGEVIASFPAYGLSYKYGGWHLTRSLAAHNNKIYVSIGSSCNACIEKEAVRASIVEMDTDGRNQIIYASGLRNSVGIGFLGNELWATSMGRDLIGGDIPEDLFLKVEKAENYGWPFYYQYKGKIFEDKNFKDTAKPSGMKKPPIAFQGFAAHVAPLGFEYMSGFDQPDIKNSVLVCLHGSNTASRHRGNEIVKVEGGNKYQPVVTGFLQGETDKERLGRPCDIIMKDNKSFFFTDDTHGVLYYVYSQKGD